MGRISLGNSDVSLRLASNGESQSIGGFGLNGKVLRNGIGGFDSTKVVVSCRAIFDKYG
ncbi:hypothetical protein PCE12_001462 [Salmonella enterica]|nr:hypothetical protein [Salmonella enterica]EKI1747016.1 hypothetical protein [Salmonella enterica]EKJ4120943.1 hypothetical protein [Salmonella enterica]ELO6264041.1 hypothetical protein [Salmonella enterica]